MGLGAWSWGMSTRAPQWERVELKFTASENYPNPYTDQELWVDFTHSDGRVLRRPGFWDGGKVWRVRFASPLAQGAWSWKSETTLPDSGLSGRKGKLSAVENSGEGPWARRGLLGMSPGKRNAVYSNGEACMLVADTAWGLPWRATLEQCETYARDRSGKGFNAALLMTVQPDMDARGPQDREAFEGFGVGFTDLSRGELKLMAPRYFRYFDKLVELLLQHGIIPVYQPVFHGFGWKGLRVAGRVLSAEDSARYCRFLVARYGDRPAIYLIGGDGFGYDKGVRPGGQEVEAWDCYAQPAGIHYSPHASDKAYQSDAWLDFQWCQTGHAGEHRPEKVAAMWLNKPAKGVANGEPTYESMGSRDKASGSWQGRESWLNLCAGGTMGVFYGAGGLWNWVLDREEPGHQDWCQYPGGNWRDALGLPGSHYPGVIGRLLEGLPFADMAPDPQSAGGARCLSVAGKFALVYLESGGSFWGLGPKIPANYRVFKAMTGELVSEGVRDRSASQMKLETGCPLVVLFCQQWPD